MTFKLKRKKRKTKHNKKKKYRVKTKKHAKKQYNKGTRKSTKYQKKELYIKKKNSKRTQKGGGRCRKKIKNVDKNNIVALFKACVSPEDGESSAGFRIGPGRMFDPRDNRQQERNDVSCVFNTKSGECRKENIVKRSFKPWIKNIINLNDGVKKVWSDKIKAKGTAETEAAKLAKEKDDKDINEVRKRINNNNLNRGSLVMINGEQLSGKDGYYRFRKEDTHPFNVLLDDIAKHTEILYVTKGDDKGTEIKIIREGPKITEKFLPTSWYYRGGDRRTTYQTQRFMGEDIFVKNKFTGYATNKLFLDENSIFELNDKAEPGKDPIPYVKRILDANFDVGWHSFSYKGGKVIGHITPNDVEIGADGYWQSSTFPKKGYIKAWDIEQKKRWVKNWTEGPLRPKTKKKGKDKMPLPPGIPVLSETSLKRKKIKKKELENKIKNLGDSSSLIVPKQVWYTREKRWQEKNRDHNGTPFVHRLLLPEQVADIKNIMTKEQMTNIKNEIKLNVLMASDLFLSPNGRSNYLNWWIQDQPEELSIGTKVKAILTQKRWSVSLKKQEELRGMRYKHTWNYGSESAYTTYGDDLKLPTIREKAGVTVWQQSSSGPGSSKIFHKHQLLNTPAHSTSYDKGFEEEEEEWVKKGTLVCSDHDPVTKIVIITDPGVTLTADKNIKIGRTLLEAVYIATTTNNDGEFYDGEITHNNWDQTYTIKFDNGDVREKVPLNEILTTKQQQIKKLEVEIQKLTGIWYFTADGDLSLQSWYSLMVNDAYLDKPDDYHSVIYRRRKEEIKKVVDELYFWMKEGRPMTVGLSENHKEAPWTFYHNTCSDKGIFGNRYNFSQNYPEDLRSKPTAEKLALGKEWQFLYNKMMNDSGKTWHGPWRGWIAPYKYYRDDVTDELKSWDTLMSHEYEPIIPLPNPICPNNIDGTVPFTTEQARHYFRCQFISNGDKWEKMIKDSGFFEKTDNLKSADLMKIWDAGITNKFLELSGDTYQRTLGSGNLEIIDKTKAAKITEQVYGRINKGGSTCGIKKDVGKKVSNSPLPRPTQLHTPPLHNQLLHPTDER